MTPSWSDGLVAVDLDVVAGSRRCVTGQRADGARVARVGSASNPEIEVVDSEFERRAPRVAPLSRVAGAVAPALCSWAPTLSHDPVEVVRTYIEDFKNRQKFSVLFRAFHAGFQHGFGYPGDGGGWASWVATGRGFLSGFPDVQVEVHDLFTHGPYVVESNTATGTHQGWFRGLAPTGRVVQWREVHVYEVERGKIVRNHPVVELEGLVRQLQA